MSCSEETLVIQVWFFFGTFLLVFGDWLVHVLRLVYRRQGGWRANYSQVVPGWALIAAGCAALFFALGFAVHWYQRCGIPWVVSPGGIAVWVLSGGLAIFAIGRLVQGRMRIRASRIDEVAGEPAGEGDALNSAPKWRVPSIIRRMVVEYAVTSIGVISLSAVAYSMGS